jgi:hypothetical protein
MMLRYALRFWTISSLARRPHPLSFFRDLVPVPPVCSTPYKYVLVRLSAWGITCNDEETKLNFSVVNYRTVPGTSFVYSKGIMS